MNDIDTMDDVTYMLNQWVFINESEGVCHWWYEPDYCYTTNYTVISKPHCVGHMRSVAWF